MTTTTTADVRAAALAYARLGLHPIPVPFRSKNPGFDGWQNLHIGVDDVPRYFNGRPLNIGVLCGFGGMIDVDLDCREAVTVGRRFLQPTVRFGRAGNPDSHYIYSANPVPKTKKFREVGDDEEEKRPMILEVRSVGLHTVFPPSVHESGEPVEFADGVTLETFAPAVVDAPHLLAIASKVAAGALLARHWPGQGQRHDLSLALASILLRAGWAEEDAREFIEAVARAAGDDEIDNRTEAVESTAERIGLGGAVTGWPTFIEIVGKAAADKFGDWLGIDRRDREQPQQQQNTTPPPITPQFASVAELARDNPRLRDPVIEGLLRRGETMNVISVPKIGKSWLVLDLAIAEATGRVWLGKFPTVAGDVLIIDNELHRQTIANRIPKVAAARGVLLSELGERLCVDSLRGRLRDIYAMDSYFRAIEPGRFKLIILDAFYRFLPREADESSNADLAAIYNRIDAYADRLGCCFVCIHHSSKGVQAGKAVTDVGSGAGAQSRAVDSHLILRHHEQPDAVVLEAAVRSWAPVQPFCLRWEFPVWKSADDLDPEDLRVEGRRKRKVEEQPAEPAVVWTPERFAAEFLADTPRTKGSIISKAVRAGLSERKAEGLLEEAEEERRAFRWVSSRRNEAVRFAAVEQPVTEVK